jgi:hypothetical protein
MKTAKAAYSHPDRNDGTAWSEISFRLRSKQAPGRRTARGIYDGGEGVNDWCAGRCALVNLRFAVTAYADYRYVASHSSTFTI